MKHLFIILKYLFRGIAWGCTYFVFFCLIAFFWQGKDFLLGILECFPKHAIGAMLVGISVFFFVASHLAWIPMPTNRYIILELLVSCITFAAVWTGFYLIGCKEAKEINDRLQELEKRQTGSQE